MISRYTEAKFLLSSKVDQRYSSLHPCDNSEPVSDFLPDAIMQITQRYLSQNKQQYLFLSYAIALSSKISDTNINKVTKFLFVILYHAELQFYDCISQSRVTDRHSVRSTSIHRSLRFVYFWFLIYFSYILSIPVPRASSSSLSPLLSSLIRSYPIP